MGRKAMLDKPVDVHLKLPAPLVGEISLLLWSEARGCIPMGKLSEFFTIAAKEKLARIHAEVGESGHRNGPAVGPAVETETEEEAS